MARCKASNAVLAAGRAFRQAKAFNRAKGSKEEDCRAADKVLE